MADGKRWTTANLNVEIDDQYARVDAHGFYWTASENHPATAAVFYNVARGRSALYRQPEGEKGRAFSVRCVRE